MTPETDASSVPAPERRPLWGQLPPGPYGVGYQSFFALDYARSYDLFYPDSAPVHARKQPRPLLVNLWFPAKPDGSAEPMRQGEYLLPAVNRYEALEPFSERLSAFHRDGVCEEVMGKPVAQLDAAERAAYEQFCQTPTAVIKAWRIAEGPFPLVLYHPGYGGSTVDNTVLFEFLASHGYVVVTSAYQSNDAAELRVGHDVERSNQDLAYLLNDMDIYPNVDMERIGVMGCSYGAQAVLAWVAEAHPTVSAVVSLDTTLEYCPLDQEEVREERCIRVNQSLRDVRTRFDNAPRLSVPMLILTQARLSPDFALYEKLPCSERYYAQVKFVNHFHFASIAVATQSLRTEAAVEKGQGDAQQIQEAYEQICRLTLRFLDAYLKEDQPALAFLQHRVDASGDRAQIEKSITWDYRKAEHPADRGG
jgi:pimeloyl-ACP methyl ester carboxylesterase